MRLQNLTMSFGTQVLFENINLTIGDNEKVGVVGVNGAGKTTFFKIIRGVLEPDQGKVILGNKVRVGFLPQVISDEVPSMEISVLDFLIDGRPIEKLNDELQRVYELLSKEVDENQQQQLYKKINKIQSQLDYFDVYQADSILLKIIDGMQISDHMLEQSLSSLSGGQKSKVAFARLLYSKPELILLDEPTNHLDNKTKDYVVNYLKQYKGSVFIISHDTEFLNAVVSQILFLDKRNKTMTLYHGNYDTFKKLNEAREESIARQAKKDERKEEKLRGIITKYASASGKRKKMAQDREKKLERLLENKVVALKKVKSVKIQMPINQESTKEPLIVKNLHFKYNKADNKYIIDNLSFSLSRGEKFLVVGPNGIGKSTLLKLLVGQLKPDMGEIIIGKRTEIGYYAQEHELLDNTKTILDNFLDIDISSKDLRNVLGRFLFYGDDVFKKVGVLSPGERSRVALAKLSLQGANVLILDEPTNHLDPETQRIIAETFREYLGTMLVVSHNPEFVDNLGVERILTLPSGKIDYYDRKMVEYYEQVNNNSKVKRLK